MTVQPGCPATLWIEMGKVMEIEDHYSQLLGIYSPWSISDVALNLERGRVDIVIEYTDDTGPCPECCAESLIHDETWSL